MELSSKLEYAMLALIELASCQDPKNPLKISEIAKKQSIPERYLEQILNNLRLSGLIKSQRGAKGGYILACEPQQITLLEIIDSVKGDRKLKQNKPSDYSTLEKEVVCEICQQADEEARAIWQRYTLEDICKQRDARRQTNLMYYI